MPGLAPAGVVLLSAAGDAADVALDAEDEPHDREYFCLPATGSGIRRQSGAAMARIARRHGWPLPTHGEEGLPWDEAPASEADHGEPATGFERGEGDDEDEPVAFSEETRAARAVLDPGELGGGHGVTVLPRLCRHPWATLALRADVSPKIV